MKVYRKNGITKDIKERFHYRKETRSQSFRACFFTVMEKNIKQSKKHARIATGNVTGAFRPFRLPESQETGRIFLRKISTFGGRPPFWTIWILAFFLRYRIRKQIFLHREDIRMRTLIVKPKPSTLHIQIESIRKGLSCTPCIPTAPHQKQILALWGTECKRKK